MCTSAGGILTTPEGWRPNCVVSTHTRRVVGASLALEHSEYKELLHALRSLKWADALTTPGLFGQLKSKTAAGVGYQAIIAVPLSSFCHEEACLAGVHALTWISERCNTVDRCIL